jgi:hypothetical protein
MCGQLSVRCRGEPDIVSICHCLACQRRTGGVFGVSAFFSRANVVETVGQSKVFGRTGEAGRRVTFNFCPECGGTVFWELDLAPAHVGVAVGAFADPSFSKPVRAVWTQSQHPWVTLPEGIARFPQEES